MSLRSPKSTSSTNTLVATRAHLCQRPHLRTTSRLGSQPTTRERQSWCGAGWWQEPPILLFGRLNVGGVAISITSKRRPARPRAPSVTPPFDLQTAKITQRPTTGHKQTDQPHSSRIERRAVRCRDGTGSDRLRFLSHTHLAGPKQAAPSTDQWRAVSKPTSNS